LKASVYAGAFYFAERKIAIFWHNREEEMTDEQIWDLYVKAQEGLDFEKLSAKAFAVAATRAILQAASTAPQDAGECNLCDGQKSMPPEVGAYKYTCPHCDGSGKEPQSAAPASVAPTHQDVDDKSACSSKSAENCDQAVSAAQPAVTLPDRVIDTLFQAAGVSTYHPDGDQLEKLHDFAHRVAAEVLARLPSAPASTAPAVPEGWKLVPIEPTMDMVVDGFEAVSDFHDTDEYEEMSGCEGSAQSARVCYRAMLAAVPHQLKG
jgi:hypothetical protein